MVSDVLLFPVVLISNDLSASNPWYIIAAVAFSASNRPDAVPHVFQHAIKDLQTEEASGIGSLEEKRLVARKLRDALFKSGLTSGYPRVRVVCILLVYSTESLDIRQSIVLLP